MRRSMLIRVFALYMIALYLWAIRLEWKALMACDKPERLFVHSWVNVSELWHLLFLAPTMFYVAVALIIAPLAFSPSLLGRGRYAKLLAYALAPFATAWISGAMISCPARDELYEFILSEKKYLLWSSLGYPIAYAIYAVLVYRVFDPILGGIDASEISPRFHKASTKAARLVAPPLMAFSIVSLILLAARSPFGMFAPLIYPAIGLYLVGYSRIKSKPYRFLIAFPLLGQAVCWRTLIFDLELLLNNILAGGGPSWIIPDNVAHIIAPLLIVRWLMFPVPGFSGAQASLALSDYLEYKFYGRLIWMNSPPTFITPLWLLGEWLIFYKALKKVYHYNAPTERCYDLENPH